MEFVLLGILVLIPLLYLVISVFELQRNAFAVTQAAREAGRAFVHADDEETGIARAEHAVRLALRDQGLAEGSTQLKFVRPDTNCADDKVTNSETSSASDSVTPNSGAATLAPGADFAVCVIRTFHLPAVPSIMDGQHNTVTGRYLVHIDDFRAAS